MSKVDEFKYPLDVKAIACLAHTRGLSPARIKRELRTLHCRRVEVARACKSSAKYSWTWASGQMKALLRRHVPDDGMTIDELYWRIRCSDPPCYTRWVTLSDITQMAKKHGYMAEDGRLCQPDR